MFRFHLLAAGVHSPLSALVCLFTDFLANLFVGLEHGELYSWGSFSSGKLGLGMVCEDVRFPMLIEHTTKDPVDQVICGWDHSISISRKFFSLI